MHSRSSADLSFVSTDEHEHGEIELAAEHDSGVAHMIEGNDRSREGNKEEITTDTKFLLKWNQIIVVLAFTALLSLIGTSIVIDGQVMSEVLLKQFVMINIISFFFAINGTIVKCAEISKLCSLIALVSTIFSFTVLSSALVPPNFIWIPWILFSLTCYVVCDVCCYVRHQKKGNEVN